MGTDGSKQGYAKAHISIVESIFWLFGDGALTIFVLQQDCIHIFHKLEPPHCANTLIKYFTINSLAIIQLHRDCLSSSF